MFILKFHSETIITQETKFKLKLINQLHLNGNYCSFKIGWWVQQSIKFGFFKPFIPDYCSHICSVTESEFPILTYCSCYKLHHCLNSTHFTLAARHFISQYAQTNPSIHHCSVQLMEMSCLQ